MYSRWSIMLISLAFCACLSGCGQKVRDSVSPLSSSIQFSESKAQQIVILPLADYTVGVRPDDSLRRQVKVNEALTYRLAERGFYVPLKEDVVQYLADLGVIRIIETPSIQSKNYSRFIETEMNSGWSDAMQEEVQKLLVLNEYENRSEERIEITKVGLNPGTIRQIGRYFGVDYVLRGRIVEYEIREGNTLNPLQRGLLPFFFDTTSATVFGVAESDQYDLWQDLAVGGVFGALLGSEANTPFNAPRKKVTVSGASHPRFATETVSHSGGYSGHAGLNAGVWGGAGAAAAYLASKGGRVPQAVVQLSLALQDVRDGRIIWANRVEKQVEPVTIWADPAVRTQIDLAVEDAAAVLASDLAAALDKISSERLTAAFEVQNQVVSAELPRP